MIRARTILGACLILGLTTAPAFAQSAPNRATAPGSWLLGGWASWSSLGGDSLDTRINTLMIAPSVLAFVVPNFGLGIRTEVTRVSQGDLVDVNHAYLGKLMFVVPTGNRFRPVVAGGGGFIRQSTNDSGSDDSVNGWTLRLAGGAFYFLNEHYALSAEFDYAYSKLLISAGEHPASNTIAFAIGFAGFVF